MNGPRRRSGSISTRYTIPTPSRRSRRRCTRWAIWSRPGVTIIACSPLAQGATPAQVAPNWLVHARGDAVVAIPAATRVEQAEENAVAMSFRLSDSDIARLDEVSRPFLG